MTTRQRNIRPKDSDSSRFSRRYNSLEPNFLARQSAVYLLTVLAGTGVATLSGCSQPANVVQTEPSVQPVVNSSNQSQSANSSTLTDPNFIVTAVQKVGPAVVRIDSSRTVTRQVPQDFSDPLFRFFGSGQTAPPAQEIVRGTGSGFIINSGGQILTNAHVINGTDTVSVSLKDGRTFKGQVLGEDRVTDVAVVKIPASNLPVVAIGNSDVLQPGEATIAIGNPLGLDNTVTAGIVSATNRSSSAIGVPDERVGFIQTDAAINPGNSGGPLLNARGEVIGMNTAIISGAQGLGFAIPVNTAQRIAQQLIAKGKVEHAYLGVVMVTLTPEIKQKLNNASDGSIRVIADQGVLVVRVVPNSPAVQAGLRPGDVIQKLNNQPVTTKEEVQQLVETSTIGNQLQIEIQRNGQYTQLAIKPAPLPEQPES